MLFKHKVTSAIYEFMGLGLREADLVTTIMYRPFGHAYPIWSRPATEFFEKFEPYLFLNQAPDAFDLENTPAFDEPELDQTIGDTLLNAKPA